MSVIKHILKRHRAQTEYDDVSKFLTNSARQIRRLVREGVAEGVETNGERSLIAAFSRNIGRDINGELTNKVKIFYDEKGWVRTAFPW